jgi:hypothetical protein
MVVGKITATFGTVPNFIIYRWVDDGLEKQQ